jgi:ferredoxin|tara:strand:+ start:3022 stop:3297 length:276 start_codon:yes stop_codon:yes gene_type:complete
MTHVVTSACVNHKYQDCVSVCPVDAFREAKTYLIIDPDECIDCGACITECPVSAIYYEDDVPDDEFDWIQKNEDESIDAEIAEGDSPVLAE